ncbi:phosphoglycolate phosphatase-like HAD superfamily hydrolase [Arthrobacter sp. UYCu511]|uniref:HAD family hydrolase n=1 Tax=Arthrobacter sp. UYCu511 TaxID=3156337 RepID=UPI003393CC83
MRQTLDADDPFFAAASFSDADRGRPTPDIIAAALDTAGVYANHAIFIGDGMRGAAAAVEPAMLNCPTTSPWWSTVPARYR